MSKLNKYLESINSNFKFYTATTWKDYEKFWKNKNFIDRLTNVAGNKSDAELFLPEKDGVIIEIDAPKSCIVGVRNDNYYDDDDWIETKFEKEKENCVYEYNLFLIDLYNIDKNLVKIKLVS